jgi:GntR family transcriptional regulator, transcriptional repressor for pyruvate dehydrogenase complex
MAALFRSMVVSDLRSEVGPEPTMFELRAIDKNKLYALIVDQIVQGVQSGAFLPGQVLPAERLLASRFNVSRSSVREAIRVLEHAGVVEVRSGRGTLITQEGFSNASILRARAELTGDHSPLDIIAARRVLEPSCAGLAAEQRHERDLVSLRRIISEHEHLNGLGEDVEDVDLSFHLAIAGACHNPVFLTLVEYLVQIMQHEVWRELKYRARAGPEFAALDLQQHREIYAAIRKRDPQEALAKMQGHLDTVEATMLAELS